MTGMATTGEALTKIWVGVLTTGIVGLAVTREAEERHRLRRR